MSDIVEVDVDGQEVEMEEVDHRVEAEDQLDLVLLEAVRKEVMDLDGWCSRLARGKRLRRRQERVRLRRTRSCDVDSRLAKSSFRMRIFEMICTPRCPRSKRRRLGSHALQRLAESEVTLMFVDAHTSSHDVAKTKKKTGSNCWRN